MEVFERLFIRSVQQAVSAGLVDGKKLHVDGSLIDANASNDAWVKGDALWIDHLKQAYRREDEKLDAISEHSLDKGANQTRFNSTDIDASFTGKDNGKETYRKARYKTHRGVDDKKGIITASITTTGSVSENKCLFDVIGHSQAHTAIKVAEICADSQYGTYHNLQRCINEGIRAHIKPLHKSRRRNLTRIPAEQFEYDRANNCYRCPMGQTLKFYSVDWSNCRFQYRCSSTVCGKCELAQQCLGQERARIITRAFEQDLIESMPLDEQLYVQNSRRRMSMVERSFADASNNHHLKRARWRRLWRQEIQNYLIAAIQNIKTMLRAAKTPDQGKNHLLASSFCLKRLQRALFAALQSLRILFMPVYSNLIP